MTCRSIGRLSVLLLLLLGLVLYVAGRISAFAQIFLADSRAGIRVTQSAAAAAHANASEDARPQLIPKILHQVFHNWKDPGNDKKLPADWERVRQTCIDKNPDWEYRVRLSVEGVCGCGRNRDAVADDGCSFCSCGRRKRRATLSRPNTPGS